MRTMTLILSVAMALSSLAQAGDISSQLLRHRQLLASIEHSAIEARNELRPGYKSPYIDSGSSQSRLIRLSEEFEREFPHHTDDLKNTLKKAGWHLRGHASVKTMLITAALAGGTALLIKEAKATEVSNNQKNAAFQGSLTERAQQLLGDEEVGNTVTSTTSSSSNR